MNLDDRVQLAPHLDHWMKGDRYGTVVGFKHLRPAHQEGQTYVQVLLDKSEKRPYFLSQDLTVIGSIHGT